MRSLPALLVLHQRRLGLTQGELAKRAGVTDAAVSLAIRGKMGLNPKRARRWCRALDLKGADAKEFILAVHLSAASPLVRAYLRRLERQARKS